MPVEKPVYNPLEYPEKPEMVLDLQSAKSEQVSVIVVHHNRPEFLNMCAQSIHIMSNLHNYEMIVVDNNSEQETQDFLDAIEAEGVKVVRNKENLYWSAAANRGVAVADPGSAYFIFMHCDTVVLHQGWIDVLINIAEGKSSGMVGTQLAHYFIQRQQTDYVQECCVLMSRQCWNDCGPCQKTYL